ncbi:hypothetical protein ABKN59_000781 [Abortiporus biennis]
MAGPTQPPPSLPSVLPSSPALQDVTTTPEQLPGDLGRVTNPTETPIFSLTIPTMTRKVSRLVKVPGSNHSLRFNVCNVGFCLNQIFIGLYTKDGYVPINQVP